MAIMKTIYAEGSKPGMCFNSARRPHDQAPNFCLGVTRKIYFLFKAQVLGTLDFKEPLSTAWKTIGKNSCIL